MSMKVSKKVMCSLLMFCLVFGMNVNAQGSYNILQSGVYEDSIVTYIEGEGKASEVTCQIGMTPIAEVSVAEIGEEKIHTIIMVDNSLSVTKENSDKIKSLLEVYVNSKNENEYISVATFGEDIQFLAEKIVEKEVLLEAITQIVSNNQDTHLTDVLYELLDNVNTNEFTRFLIITDGVDNKQIGITKEELTEKLKNNAHPIYAIGHIYKDNQSQLENFFALARLTGGKEVLLDDVEDVSSIVDDISNIGNVMKVNAVIPQQLMDGSEKSVLFSVVNESGTSEIVTEIRLPFSIQEETETIEETVVEETVEEIVEGISTEEIVTEEETTQEVVEEENKEKKSNTITYVLGVVFLVVLVILLILNNKKKGNGESKKDNKKKNKKDKKTEIPQTPVMPEINTQPQEDYDNTIIMNGRYLLVLKDMKDANKVFRYPLDEKVIIGRNVDKVQIAIDYNQGISGQHCEIYSKFNRFYINDLNSVNHTYVNNRQCVGETEIINGTIIRLGDLELQAEFLPI